MAEEIDDAEWDEWMAMTDTQRDAAVDREMALFLERWRSLSLGEEVAHLRANWLDACLRWRRLIAADFVPDVAREHLRTAQRHLLMVREYRRTGIYPGEG